MKKLVLLLCFFLVFVACGKDEKTIEKIIYGDKTSSVLDKDDYNKVAITQSFNSFNDFKSYALQCAENKTNLAGKKFKVRDTFKISIEGFNSIGEKHFFIFKTYINSSDTQRLEFTLKYIDTKEAPEQVEMEMIFIVTKCQYYSIWNTIEGYSYSL